MTDRAETSIAKVRTDFGKRCGQCSQILPVESFTVRRCSSDGLNSACRECSRAQWRARYRPHPRPPTSERFYSRFFIEPNSGCWLWTGGVNNLGYGVAFKDGQRTGAHRVSWELHFGRIPDGEGYHGVCVLHKCDTPCCVNPNHLFLGTHTDNMVDKSSKGRSRVPRGEANHLSKLTDADVVRIRKMPGTLKKIANEFGVHFSIIADVKHRRTWAHIP